jgi:hypothetical protein
VLYPLSYGGSGPAEVSSGGASTVGAGGSRGGSVVGVAYRDDLEVIDRLEVPRIAGMNG